MKFLLKLLFAYIILFCSITSADAATITWLGGSGAWDDPSRWDTGTVPGYGDDVIIPSGYCRVYSGVYASATSVEVHSSGRLYINNGGELEISGTVNNDALHNMGRVYIHGFLAINDVSRTSSVYSAKAIKNERYIYSYSESYINIKYIDDIGIYNVASTSYFRIQGGLTIYQVDNTGIWNEDRFYNYGTININDSGVSSGFLIYSKDDFRNMSSGIINLNSDNYGGISNTSTSAPFRNYGEINIDGVEVGINNSAELTNYSEAHINVENAGASGFWNRKGATITNDGDLFVRDSNAGIYNYGKLITNNSFVVFFTIQGIRNFADGRIENSHHLIVESTGPIDIENDGDIYNFNGGYFQITGKLHMNSGSSFLNYGFFILSGSSLHVVNGSFGNKGVIDDNYGQLLPLISNDGIVIAPVSGTMQVGVPFSNVLDVGSLAYANIYDWKVSQNGVVAGTYNETTNEFTPNASAIGVSTLYIEIYDIATGVGRNFSLELTNPVSPFSRKFNISSTRNQLDDNPEVLASTDLNIYPNPSSGNIQLDSKIFSNNNADVHIFNNLGQLVQQERFISASDKQSIELSNQLMNGIYIIKILQEGKEIESKRIQLHR